MEHAQALKRSTANLTPVVLEQLINEAIDSELAAGRICACDSCSCRTDAQEEEEAPAEPEYTEEADDFGSPFSQ